MDSRATLEFIVDGIHVHPAVIQLAIAARGMRDIALVTDAVAPAGLPEGKYEFVGREVIVCDGAVRLTNGSLASSILTLDRAARNIVAFTKLGWPQASLWGPRYRRALPASAPARETLFPEETPNWLLWTSRDSCSAPGCVVAPRIMLHLPMVTVKPHKVQRNLRSQCRSS